MHLIHHHPFPATTTTTITSNIQHIPPSTNIHPTIFTHQIHTRPILQSLRNPHTVLPETPHTTNQPSPIALHTRQPPNMVINLTHTLIRKSTRMDMIIHQFIGIQHPQSAHQTNKMLTFIHRTPRHEQDFTCPPARFRTRTQTTPKTSNQRSSRRSLVPIILQILKLIKYQQRPMP